MQEPLDRRSYMGVQDMIGAINSAQTAREYLTPRMERLLPGAIGEMEKGHDHLVNAYRAVLGTIPKPKLERIRMDLDHTRVYVRVEAQGISTIDTTLWRYVPAPVLNRLVDYVARHECFLCDKSRTEGRHCPIREMMEAVLPHEIDYRAPDGCCKWSGLALGLEGGGGL